MSSIAGNPTYDVACNKWGSPWRLPTDAELCELEDNCTWEWTTRNGHNGYKVTSKKNGNSIFLPAAGLSDGTSSSDQGSEGYYWSASSSELYPHQAYCIFFYEGDRGVGYYFRNHGYSVRPVSE